MSWAPYSPLEGQHQPPTPSIQYQQQQQQRRRGANATLSWLSLYVSRMFHLPQMDLEYALWQMKYLCLDPRRVYRNIYYHKQTRNRWARDDPAFVLLLSLFLSVTAIAYGLAYSPRVMGILKLILYMVFVDFLLVGLCAATACWMFANTILHANPPPPGAPGHAVELVEWAYAFDVHCNSFLPLFLVVYVVMFFALPLLAQPTWVAAWIGNTLYLLGSCAYIYLTFLGYSVLPFLRNTTLLLYPITILLLLYLLFSFGLGVNLSLWFSQLYFS